MESSRVLIKFSSKYNEKSRLAVIRWFLVEKVLLKQGKQQNIPEKSVGGL